MTVKRTGAVGTGAVGGSKSVPAHVAIRDGVAKLRANIKVTLQDLKAGIKAGDPKAQQKIGDGKLEGIEVAQAQQAANAIGRALANLEPVAGKSSFPTKTARANLNRGDGFHPIAMYGVVLADDLRKYRTEISTNIETLTAAIKSGALAGKAKSEGQKALRQLNAALKDLGGIPF